MVESVILQQIAEDAAERAYQKYAAHPPCGLTPEAAKEVQHLFGMVKDAGSGDYARGVEVMRASTRFASEMEIVVSSDDWREDMRFIRKWRRMCERTGNIVLCAIVMSILGISGVIAGKGFWAWIQGSGK